MPFMSEIIKKLKPEGKLTMATNMSFYHREALEFMIEQWGFKLIKSEESPFSFAPRTHFEKKYLNRLETCFNALYQVSK